MPTDMSVKNVPDDVVERLRRRAKRHHRSLQGELMAILEEATAPARLSLEEADSWLRALALTTGDESTSWIRESRDAACR